MRHFIVVCVLVVIGAQLAMAAADGLIESTETREDIAPSTDPAIAFWRAAPPVYAERGPQGETLASHRTEVRSRWTKKNLYFLFICPYDKLNLKPSPIISTETFRLWDWDVAEVFIGADFQNIRRYKCRFRKF